MKNDLRDTYPFGLFASPMKDVVRLHASSGTTGKPIVVAYTKEDVDVWTSVAGRAALPAAVCIAETSFKSPTVTVFLPAGWARTMAPKRWGPRSFPLPAATPPGRSC